MMKNLLSVLLIFSMSVVTDETKDILKSNQYRWNPNKKFWFKRISKDEINNEKVWLTDKVYKGFFKGIIEEISLQDKYKK